MKICDDLRAAVLQAAIQGKLTRQFHEDGTASDLLKKIAEEKSQLVKNNIIKKEKNLPTIMEEETDSFSIPENWSLIRLGEISTYSQTKEKINASKADGELWLLDLEDIEKGGRLLQKNKVKDKKAVGDKTVFHKGDILYSKLRPYLLKVLTVDQDGICTPELIPFKMYGGIVNEYIVNYLKSPYVDQEINRVTYGVKMPRVGTETMVNFIVPLPPIAEQHRIVAKVDELMEKIDELEKIENQLESLKEDFPGDMKAALLQAAMQGKLTEQLEDDGDAVGLAEVIKVERNKLGKNKYIKGNIEDANIPDSWTAIKSGECFSLEKGTNVKEVSLPYLEAKYLRGKVSATMMTEGEFVSKGEKVILVDGENSGEVFIEPEDGIIGSTFKVLFIPESINEKYALYFLDMYRDQFRNNKKGAAIPHLNKDIFNNLLLPIPPIEEQQRIVEKLDQLLPLCDGLCEEKLQEAM